MSTREKATMNQIRTLYTVLFIAALIVVHGSASALDWPKKAIQIIVPFAPGGDTDFNCRSYIEHLSKNLGTDVVIISTTGNAGAIGARKAKDSPNDGYTIFFFSSAFLANQLTEAIDFGLEAFEFACIAGQNPGNLICVSSELGVSNMKELVEYTKAHPGQLRIAADTGGNTHVIALMLQSAGVDADIVDVGASGDRIAALLGGHVNIIINSYGAVKDYLASGDFVALGVASDVEPEYIPDIPTCISQGYDVSLPLYYSFAFPKGTNPEIVAAFANAVEDVARNNARYADTIKTAFSQSVTYYGGDEGRAKFAELKKTFDKYQKFFATK